MNKLFTIIVILVAFAFPGSGGLITHNQNASNMYVLSAKSVTILTAGAPADIATLPLPAGITRYRMLGNVGGNSGNFMITETQAGTPAAGTCELRDAAAGAGNALCAANAPANGAGTGIGWVPAGNNTISTATTLYIRQTANSASAATVSFYVQIEAMP